MMMLQVCFSVWSMPCPSTMIAVLLCAGGQSDAERIRYDTNWMLIIDGHLHSRSALSPNRSATSRAAATRRCTVHMYTQMGGHAVEARVRLDRLHLLLVGPGDAPHPVGIVLRVVGGRRQLCAAQRAQLRGEHRRPGALGAGVLPSGDLRVAWLLPARQTG